MAGIGGARPVVGLVVNPIAGMGGRVGLKGTDGQRVLAAAIERGARPLAAHRAREALQALGRAWPRTGAPPRLLTIQAPMGADAVPDDWLGGAEVSPMTPGSPTGAGDTVAAVSSLAGSGADLILFAGGDGTARDVHAAMSELVVTRSVVPAVLGIPAGVKIQSAVFATGPAAAGVLAATWLASGARRTADREVLDLDEDAYRDGRIAPLLHGVLSVPVGRMVQGRKTASPPDERAEQAALAREIVGVMEPGRRYVLGPGTTIASIAKRLGVPKTLTGVDVVEVDAPSAGGGPRVMGSSARIVAADAGERELLAILAATPATIIVTPIGGQGFLFGRGNQPISSAVVRSVGLEHIMIVATGSKLAALGGRPLLVDTGDASLDAVLAGPTRVITGEREAAIVSVEPA